MEMGGKLIATHAFVFDRYVCSNCNHPAPTEPLDGKCVLCRKRGTLKLKEKSVSLQPVELIVIDKGKLKCLACDFTSEVENFKSLTRRHLQCPNCRGSGVDPTAPLTEKQQEYTSRTTTSGHFGEYDFHIKLFTEAMIYKLRLNKDRGNIGDVDYQTLIECMKKEVAELEEAASRGNHVEMMLECADIANFALGVMMNVMKERTS